MKYNLLILFFCFVLASCGLKKPLQGPDTIYPSEEDCECDNPQSE